MLFNILRFAPLKYLRKLANLDSATLDGLNLSLPERARCENFKLTIITISLVSPFFYVVFWPADIALAPELANQFLFIRSLMFPVSVIAVLLTRRANSLRALQLIGVAFAGCAGLVINIMIMMLDNDGYIYFGGLTLVAIGGLTCFPFTLKYFAAAAFLIYAPYYLGPGAAVDYNQNPAILVVNTFYTLNGALICLVVRLITNKISEKEYANSMKVIAERNLREQLVETALQVTHDIRGPIMGLKAIESTMFRQAPAAELFNESLIRIEGLSNSMLSAFRNSTSSRNKIEVGKLVDTIKTSIRFVKFVDTQPTFDFNIKVSLDAEIDLVTEQFERSIVNLLQNAVDSFDDFMVTDPLIKITLEEHLGFLAVAIEDNGKGLPNNIFNHLGARGVTFGKVAGNGVGLWSAKQFVQSHAGDLTFSQNPGGGTKVSLFLPI